MEDFADSSSSLYTCSCVYPSHYLPWTAVIVPEKNCVTHAHALTPIELFGDFSRIKQDLRYCQSLRHSWDEITYWVDLNII